MSKLESKPYLKSVSLDCKGIENTKVYPYTLAPVSQLDKLLFHPDVTFLIGENGAGKSTVIEAIALALGLNAEGGNKNTIFANRDTHSDLYSHLKLLKSYMSPRDSYFLRAESFYNVASYMDDVGYLKGYGNKSLHQRSHGESFLTILTDKLRGEGLYLLDEPEAALSPMRQMSALALIHGLVQEKSQFIIATHSPILMAYPRARIYHFSESGIREMEYKQTEHYQLTKDFLGNPERMVDLLCTEKC